jgi:hypothetical protein
MTRYIPSWTEINYLAKAADMASQAEARGDYQTAKRLDNLSDRLRRGERNVAGDLDNLAINTHNRIFGKD